MERDVQLIEYWRVLQRRRWVVYTTVLGCLLVAVLGSVLTTPLYRGVVSLQIERLNPEILTFRELANVDYSWAAYDDFYQTQYKILSSDAVARIAARRLDLASHPILKQRGAQPGFLTRLSALIPGAAAVAVELTPEDLAAAWVRSALEIRPVRNSHLVNVGWVCEDRDLAATVANAAVDAYIQFNLESKYSTTDQAAEFLVNQIGTLKGEIAVIEQRLQDYGENKGIVSISESNNITLKALSDIAERRTRAQTLLAETEAVYRAVSEAPAEALPEVLHSDLIARLKQDYAGHEAEYSELSRRFKSDWPGLKNLRSKMDQIRQRLDIETQTIAGQVIARARSDYEKALNEVRNLDGLLRRQETLAQQLKRDAFEYSTLQAEVDRKRETLNALITRQGEMALSSRLQDLDASSSNIRIVDRARPPTTPFKPNRKLNLLLGLALGLGLGVALAFFLEHLDNTIATPTDVERAAGLVTLASVPRHHGAVASPLSRVRRRSGAQVSGPVDLVTHRDGQAETSEAYRELRTSILLSNPGHPPRQIMVTSALPEEGKSATAVNLAVAFAQLGRRVLLVDTDLRRPRLHKVFETDDARGVSTVLSGLEQDPLALVVATGVPNLDLLPSGPVPPNPAELLNSPVFPSMGRRLVEQGYDHLIYDSAPALSVADPVIIASVVESTLIVVRAARTSRESLRLAAEKLAQAGVRPIGAVINDLDVEHHRYSGYRYYGRKSSGAPGRPELDPRRGSDRQAAG